MALYFGSSVTATQTMNVVLLKPVLMFSGSNLFSSETINIPAPEWDERIHLFVLARMAKYSVYLFVPTRAKVADSVHDMMDGFTEATVFRRVVSILFFSLGQAARNI